MFKMAVITHNFLFNLYEKKIVSKFYNFVNSRIRVALTYHIYYMAELKSFSSLRNNCFTENHTLILCCYRANLTTMKLFLFGLL